MAGQPGAGSRRGPPRGGDPLRHAEGGRLTSLRRLFLAGMRDHLAYSDALLSVANFHARTLQHVNVGLLGACGGVAGPRLEEFLDHLGRRVTDQRRLLARDRHAVHDRALDAAALYATVDEAQAAVTKAAAVSRVVLRHRTG